MLRLTDMGVYYIKNKITDKIYIGSATNGIKKRWYQHKKLLKENKHSNKSLQLDWNLYGQENFVFGILHICLTAGHALEKEQEEIIKHFGKNCYNINWVAVNGSKFEKLHIFSEANSKRIVEYFRENNKLPIAAKYEFLRNSPEEVQLYIKNKFDLNVSVAEIMKAARV